MMSMNLVRWWLPVYALVLSACSSSGGDAARGAELYAKECAACHSLSATTTNAPMHCGLFGRTAGTVPDFPYSEALRASGLVWDEKTLDEFLTAPFIVMPGTLMGFPGFPEATDRADVIAYLKQVSSDPDKCKN